MSELQSPHTPQPTVVYVQAPPRGLSIASMVIGIISFFAGFTFIVPIVGTVLGFVGLRREPAGRGFALAGIWINLLILAFWAVVTLVVVVAGIGLFTIPFWTTSS